MNIQCPGCNVQIAFNPYSIKQSGERLTCSSCKTQFILKQKPSSAQPAKTLMCKVLVANANPHFCSAIKDFLSGRRFEVVIARDGIEALQFLETNMPPQIALVDVALSGMYGFEICDFIKNNEKLKHIKIILLAAIYDKTRYKRMPTSIYGADDYIEMHHIPDDLVPKINKLLGRDEDIARPPLNADAVDFEAVAVPEEGLSDKIKDIATQDVKVEMPKGGGKDSAHEEAKRLARIIMSDIILYNQEAIESGLRSGNLLELLKDDIKEGQLYYARRVPADVRKGTSYLKNAFEELIAKMRKEIGV
jgi:CheY-like chemotaxis protein